MTTKADVLAAREVWRLRSFGAGVWFGVDDEVVDEFFETHEDAMRRWHELRAAGVYGTALQREEPTT